MTRLSTPLLFAFLCVALATSGRSPFAGTWSAKINDLPGVDLMIEEAGGKIGGTVTFYFQTRGEDGKWHVADKTTVTMLAPHVDGKVLAFEVLHHKSHGSSELGPNVKFRMELTGSDEAALRKVEDGSDAGPGTKLTRR
jgi:hypothetical protein